MTEREDYADTGGPIVDIDAQSLAAPATAGRSRRAAAILALMHKAPTHRWTATRVAAALKGQVPGGVEAFRRVLVELADRGEIQLTGRATYRARSEAQVQLEPVAAAAATPVSVRARFEALLAAKRGAAEDDGRLARIEADVAEMKKVIMALAEALGL